MNKTPAQLLAEDRDDWHAVAQQLGEKLQKIKHITYLLLSAPKDPNGNPRRIYLVFRDGELIATVDQYYNGNAEVLKAWPEAVDLLNGDSIPVSVKEYQKYYNFKNKE